MVNGNSSCLIQFRSRSASGSMPRWSASSSIIRSMPNVASGRPAPRYASVGILVVNTPTQRNRYASIL